MEQNNCYLEEEKLFRLMLKFSIPCVLSMLVGALYNIIDQIFIGNCTIGITATSVVFPMITIAMAFGLMLGDGATAYLSLCMGKRESDKIGKAIGSAITIAAGIGVVAVDTDVNAVGRACFVGSNNYEVGLEMGRAMASYLPEGGKVAVIQHMLTTTTGIDRTRGVIDALTKAGNIEILGSFCCDNSTDRAQSLTKELLEQTPDISGFVCTNEVCNVGAANALVELGMGGKVFVVGCDNSQRQIAFLEQNIIQAIVTQRPFNMGYIAVQQAVEVASGEKTADFVEVPCVLITRENMYTQENQKLLFPLTGES